MKQIIRNCPALDRSNTGYCLSEFIEEQKCEDCSDCLVKRIITHVKGVMDMKHTKYVKDKTGYASGRIDEAEEILNIFEVEERGN